MKGATEKEAASDDPPRVHSVQIQVFINGQELLALLDTGCEVDLISEQVAQKCNLSVHSLSHALRLRFADGRLNEQIGKATAVKCQFRTESGLLSMVRDFYVGPVHHDMILGMPWVTEWSARMGPRQGVIDVKAPGNNERVHLSVFPIKLTSSMVSGVESAPQWNEVGQTQESPADTSLEDKDQSATCSQEAGKTAILSESIQLGIEEQQKWDAIKKEFADVLNNNELPAGRPPAERPAHRIDLIPGAAPSYVPRYRKPPQQEEEIERQVDELLKKGKVQESTSAFGHNPVLVPKKDGRWRMCVNFKPLNKITVKQKFPMPRVDELLDRLQGSAVYSTFDFTDAFLQIPIHPADRHKTAFHTRTRKLEYTCMPFGLVNAPAELQRQVNRDFAGPINEGWMVVYMDDVLVFSRNVQEHLQHLRRALQLLREKQWYVKAQKCSFFMKTVNFLGYRVSAVGVQPDPKKLEAISAWPLPLHKRKDVQKFLGLASYYRNFIPGFARIAAPLTDLLKKEKQFVWTQAEEVAAKTLISHLTAAPVLALPDFGKQFYLTTDASDAAVGAILSQQAENSRKHHIIACYSHRFTETEQRYPVREKELYAVWWGVKKCRHYLYGRHFVVQTDHQSLTHLTKSFQDFDNPRVVRWLSRLLQYDFTVKYIKGITNVVADALSRRPISQQFCCATALVCDDSRFVAKLRASYALDTHASAVLAKLNNGRHVKHYSVTDDLLWFSTKRGLQRLYVPSSLRNDVLRKAHDHVLSGHGGVNNTIEKLARSFWWPGMRSAAEEYALSCPTCQQLKPRNALKPGLLQSLPVPDRIWTDLTMDFIVGLPEVRQFDSIYVVVDRLSKYAHFIPCSSSITAEGVAKLFLNHIWKLHGVPRSIITDRDPKFVSAFWRAFMSKLNIEHNMTTANHPEADGQTERTNRTLVQYLRLYVQQNPSAWLDFLPCAEWVYNNTVHSSIKCTPASLVYTETPLTDPVLDLTIQEQQLSTEEKGFAEHLASAKECMRKAQERQARNYDKKRAAVTFEPGDLVLVDRHALRGHLESDVSKKFATRWLGPFAVSSRVNALSYVIDFPADWRCHRTINVGFLKKFREAARHSRTLAPRRTTTTATGHSADNIEVLNCRTTTRRGYTKREYLVKYSGERHSQWISEKTLKEMLPPDVLESMLRPLGLEANIGCSPNAAAS